MGTCQAHSLTVGLFIFRILETEYLEFWDFVNQKHPHYWEKLYLSRNYFSNIGMTPLWTEFWGILELLLKTKFHNVCSRQTLPASTGFIQRKMTYFLFWISYMGMFYCFPTQQKPKCLTHALGERRLEVTILKVLDHFPLYSPQNTNITMDNFLFFLWLAKEALLLFVILDSLGS